LQWYEKFTDVDEVIPVSAKYGQGVEDIKAWILSKLPVGPSYYPKACRNPTFGLFILGMNIYDVMVYYYLIIVLSYML
jgi:hypothetical protein